MECWAEEVNHESWWVKRRGEGEDWVTSPSEATLTFAR